MDPVEPLSLANLPQGPTFLVPPGSAGSFQIDFAHERMFRARHLLRPPRGGGPTQQLHKHTSSYQLEVYTLSAGGTAYFAQSELPILNIDGHMYAFNANYRVLASGTAISLDYQRFSEHAMQPFNIAPGRINTQWEPDHVKVSVDITNLRPDWSNPGLNIGRRTSDRLGLMPDGRMITLHDHEWAIFSPYSAIIVTHFLGDDSSSNSDGFDYSDDDLATGDEDEHRQHYNGSPVQLSTTDAHTWGIISTMTNPNLIRLVSFMTVVNDDAILFALIVAADGYAIEIYDLRHSRLYSRIEIPSAWRKPKTLQLHPNGYELYLLMKLPNRAMHLESYDLRSAMPPMQWTPNREWPAPPNTQRTIETVMLIRSLEDTLLAAIPNELLFEIFKWL